MGSKRTPSACACSADKATDADGGLDGLAGAAWAWAAMPTAGSASAPASSHGENIIPDSGKKDERRPRAGGSRRAGEEGLRRACGPGRGGQEARSEEGRVGEECRCRWSPDY